MSPAFFGCACALAWFSAFMVTHVVLLFILKGRAPASVLARVFTATVVGAVATVAFLVEPKMGGVILAETYVVLVMACLFVVYAPLFFTIYTSLSIESLLIARERGGQVPVNMLYDRFVSQRLMKGRLATMADNGYLVVNGNCYLPTPKGRIIGQFFGAVKNIWRLGPGG
jgi:hypothetical protein